MIITTRKLILLIMAATLGSANASRLFTPSAYIARGGKNANAANNKHAKAFKKVEFKGDSNDSGAFAGTAATACGESSMFDVSYSRQHDDAALQDEELMQNCELMDSFPQLCLNKVASGWSLLSYNSSNGARVWVNSHDLFCANFLVWSMNLAGKHGAWSRHNKMWNELSFDHETQVFNEIKPHDAMESMNWLLGLSDKTHFSGQNRVLNASIDQQIAASELQISKSLPDLATGTSTLAGIAFCLFMCGLGYSAFRYC